MHRSDLITTPQVTRPLSLHETLINMQFNDLAIGTENLKNHRQYDKRQNTSYIPKTGSSEMVFVPQFYSLSMKTSTLVETNQLETFKLFGKLFGCQNFS